MPNTSLRERIASGQKIANAWMSIDSSYAAEVLSHAGFDSVTVDAQHGMMGRDSIVRMLQGISAGPAVPMARPSSMDMHEIGWLLDAGAVGIIAPAIDTPELAQDLVEACFYPPHGRRSYGPSRALLYGGTDYVETHRSTVMAWAMIESASAVRHMDSIISTPGLFGVFLGPNDLARDLGVPAGGPIVNEVAKVAHRLVERAHAKGIAAGLFCTGPAEAQKWAKAGFDLVTPGKDVTLLQSAAREGIQAVRSASETLIGTAR